MAWIKSTSYENKELLKKCIFENSVPEVAQFMHLVKFEKKKFDFS